MTSLENTFPLAPFLTSLSIDGIHVTLNDYNRVSLLLKTGGPWTIKLLRGALVALLVQDVQQEEKFLRKFDGFFPPSAGFDDGVSIDIERALEDLRSLNHVRRARVPDPVSQPTPSPSTTARVQKIGFWLNLRAKVRRSPTVLVLTVSALAIGAGFYFSARPLLEVDDSKLVETPRRVLPTASSIDVTGVGSPLALSIDRTWKDAAGVIVLFVVPTGLIALVLWALKRRDHIQPPEWDGCKPRNFSLGKIGDRPAPRLDSTTLDHLADSMSYFQSEQLSRRLNVRASVEASGRKGGLPNMIFHRRKQLRTVYILEDEFAKAMARSSVSKELAEGLQRRGINVAYGKFYGTLSQFRTSDGSIHLLDDMDSHRKEFLVLIFSDGKFLRCNRDAFDLETLSRWPMVAWLELRERQFWDESTALIAHYKIATYPASRIGLIQAIEQFLSEQGKQNDCDDDRMNWKGEPAFVESYLHDYVERLMGDALLWVQACSMIQPITLGLADALRLEFQSQVPPERIERLLMLPGTTHSLAGVRFSIPVLAVLRSGFVVRWDEKKQEEILSFLLDTIKKVEPVEQDSLAHLAWEWSLERVRLEIAPDKALKRLAALDKTPLGNAIRSELQQIVLPDAKLTDGHSVNPTRVPLRVKPRSHQGQRHLSRLAERSSGDGSKLGKDNTLSLTFASIDELADLDAVIVGRFINLLRRMFKAPGETVAAILSLVVIPYLAWLMLFDTIYALVLFDRSARKQKSETGRAPADSQLEVEPGRLELKHAKSGRQYSRTVTITPKVESWQMGRVYGSSDWIDPEIEFWACDSVIAEGKWSDQRHLGHPPIQSRKIRPAPSLRVTISTARMKPGPHSGAIVFSSFSGERKEIPVSIRILESRFSKLLSWLTANRCIQLYIDSLILICSGVLAYQILPPNWINRLHNEPPVLERVEAVENDRSDKGLLLHALASDADGDQFVYEWSSRPPVRISSISDDVDRDDAPDVLARASVRLEAGTQQQRIEVRIQLTDSRGGKAYYSTIVDLTATALSSNEQYMIYVGRFSTAEKAAELVARLDIMFLSARTQKSTLSDTLYRVAIGPYNLLGDAEREAAELESQGLEAVMIVQLSGTAPPPDSADDRYVVQVGTGFGTAEKADELTAQLRRRYLSAYTQNPTPPETLYRVRLGLYNSRSDASDMAFELVRRGFKGVMIFPWRGN